MKSILLIKMFLGPVEMTFGLVYSSFSLPEWQPLEMTLFAPWVVLPRPRNPDLFMTKSVYFTMKIYFNT